MADTSSPKGQGSTKPGQLHGAGRARAGRARPGPSGPRRAALRGSRASAPSHRPGGRNAGGAQRVRPPASRQVRCEAAATCWAISDFAYPGGPQTMTGWRASTRVAGGVGQRARAERVIGGDSGGADHGSCAPPGRVGGKARRGGRDASRSGRRLGGPSSRPVRFPGPTPTLRLRAERRHGSQGARGGDIRGTVGREGRAGPHPVTVGRRGPGVARTNETARRRCGTSRQPAAVSEWEAAVKSSAVLPPRTGWSPGLNPQFHPAQERLPVRAGAHEHEPVCPESPPSNAASLRE